MTQHAKLRRRAPVAPAVLLGEGPERVRFRVGETFRVPAHKERDFVVAPRRDA